MKPFAWLVMILGLQIAERQNAAAAEKQGSLVIIGGALRYDEPEVWPRIVDLAGGRGAKIAVFPTASSNPLKSGPRVMEALKKAGGDPFLVPLALKKIDVDYKLAASDPQLTAAVRAAGGVFFTGGAQDRITTALVAEDGTRTPMLEAIWAVYRQGGVIAGTSAGAAVMSRIMFHSPPSVLATLQHGVTMGKEIDRGLGFLDEAWFVEQHALIRGRFARAMVAMHAQGFKYGVAIDENTALVVTGGVEIKVLGYKGALIMDLSEATHDREVKGFNLKNARLTYLDRGDSFHLRTLALTPSAEKQGDIKIAPQSPGFDPDFHDETIFYNDILGNTIVADLMARLINNKATEATGLAFDGGEARLRPTAGFEFRFYRGKDSVGWYTGAFGGDHYTVSNIHLDIRPIQVHGPLYK